MSLAFWRRPAPPQASPSSRIEPPPLRGMRIHPETLARSAVQPLPRERPATAFRLPDPPPGVVPKGEVTMAQDLAIEDAYGFANAGPLGEGLFFLGYPYLSELAQRPEYRHISETIAREMTRKWITLRGVGDDDKTKKIAQLNDALDRFRVREIFREAAELDGFFGRSHLYLDTGNDDPAELETPLIRAKAKVRRGGLKGLRIVEPVWTYPTAYNSISPLQPDFYKPTSWYVMGKKVHASRLLTFISREVPDLLKAAYMFGGLSLSQVAKPYVDNWLRTRQSVSDLLHSFSVSGVKTNMGAALAGGIDGLYDRVQLFNQTRDTRGMMLLDNETEEFFNISTPLGTLDHLQAQAQEQMASVTGIPLVVLLGITPSGLNASSDGEMRAFYDRIGSRQEHLFRPNLAVVLDIIQLSEFGEIDPDITFSFEPLWQLDAAQQASVRKTDADTDALYLQEGVVLPEEVRQRIAAQEDSLYPGLDLSIPAPGPPQPAAEEPDEANPETDTLDRETERAPPGISGDAAFEESKHPRAPDGEFASGSGGGSSHGGSAKSGGSKRVGLKETRVENGKRVQGNGSPLPAHIQKLKIPPAWTDVKYSDDADAALLATGKDAKGRMQSVYSEAFSATQAAAKFARIHELREKFVGIEAQNAAAQKSADPKVRDAADCLALIMKMGVRPGSESDTGAKVKAYGATTLEGRHVVRAEGGAVSLQFVGKKGVSLNLPVVDEALAANLTERAQKAGADGKLFAKVSDKSLLDHTHTMDGGGFKTKDFRTHLGTATAYALVAAQPAPKTEAERKKAIMEVAKKVSQKLGNTPTIALQSYISPTVFSVWGSGS